MTKEDYSKLKTPTKEELEQMTLDFSNVLFNIHEEEKPAVSTCPTCELAAVLTASPLMCEMAAKVLTPVVMNFDTSLYRSQLALMFVMGQLFQQQQVGAFNEVEVLERMFKNSQEKI